MNVSLIKDTEGTTWLKIVMLQNKNKILLKDLMNKEEQKENRTLEIRDHKLE